MYEREQYLTEECHHQECSDTRWSRYCPIEAADIDGDAGVVLDHLNTLLYGTPTFDKGDFFYQGDSERQFFSRSYRQEYFPKDLLYVIGYQRQTTISHEQLTSPSRQVYRVRNEWYISDDDRIDGVYRHEYCIEHYPASSRVMATVSEYDLDVRHIDSPEDNSHLNMVDRPMTGYDHQQLYQLLVEIHNLELAQTAGG